MLRRLMPMACLLVGVGCGSEQEKVDASKPAVVVIDGCQYLTFRTHAGWIGFTHKGNCTNHPLERSNLGEMDRLFFTNTTDKAIEVRKMIPPHQTLTISWGVMDAVGLPDKLTNNTTVFYP